MFGPLPIRSQTSAKTRLTITDTLGAQCAESQAADRPSAVGDAPFSQDLQAERGRVDCIALDDPANAHSLTDRLARVFIRLAW